MMDVFCWGGSTLPVGNITLGNATQRRVESNTPIAYRLVKLKTGELVLQGNFLIRVGITDVIDNWKTIPTISEVEL